MDVFKFTSVKTLSRYYKLNPHENKSFEANEALAKNCCDKIEFYISNDMAWSYNRRSSSSRPEVSKLWVEPISDKEKVCKNCAKQYFGGNVCGIFSHSLAFYKTLEEAESRFVCNLWEF